MNHASPGVHTYLHTFIHLHVCTKHLLSLTPFLSLLYSQVRSLLLAAQGLSLPVVGISFHCGSGCYDATAFVVALKLAREAFDIGSNMYPMLYTML